MNKSDAQIIYDLQIKILDELRDLKSKMNFDTKSTIVECEDLEDED